MPGAVLTQRIVLSGASERTARASTSTAPGWLGKRSGSIRSLTGSACLLPGGVSLKISHGLLLPESMLRMLVLTLLAALGDITQLPHHRDVLVNAANETLQGISLSAPQLCDVQD
eukprot:1083849-Rhodomonas_salina.2